MSENGYAGKLYAKLAEIVAEVEGVGKSGFNDFHKYKYTTAEELLRALRGPLAARKIALIPSVQDIQEREIKTAKGGTSTITTVRVSFTLADGDTGETRECFWAGQGDDPGDKGLGKAYTNAVKTFLREQFLIPQGDDPEADKQTDQRAADRVEKPKPEQPTESFDRVLTDEELEVLKDRIVSLGKNPELIASSLGAEKFSLMTVAMGNRAMKRLTELERG